jgi:hypothetical protein
MNSRRDFTKDPGWNYFQALPHFLPFAKWVHVSEDTYELYVMPGYLAMTKSNREDGSYATGDLFSKHPTSERYRYLGRGDDTLILSNGLNANPLPLEGAIIQSPLVRDAVIIGSGKPYLTVLVVPEKEVEISKEQFLKDISEFIDNANELAPKYAKLEMDAIEILEPGVEYAVTEKGNAVRRKFVKQFERRIEDLYARLEASNHDSESKGIRFCEEEIKEYLQVALVDVLKIPDAPHEDSDFFSLGLDSLSATTFWRRIIQEINTGGQAIRQNILFERPTINKLSTYLFSLQTGHDIQQKPAVEIMQNLLEKYTDFPNFEPCSPGVDWEGKHIVSSIKLRASPKRYFLLINTFLVTHRSNWGARRSPRRTTRYQSRSENRLLSSPCKNRPRSEATCLEIASRAEGFKWVDETTTEQAPVLCRRLEPRDFGFTRSRFPRNLGSGYVGYTLCVEGQF